jgi:hypothetical protein
VGSAHLTRHPRSGIHSIHHVLTTHESVSCCTCNIYVSSKIELLSTLNIFEIEQFSNLNRLRIWTILNLNDFRIWTILNLNNFRIWTIFEFEQI